MIKSNFKYYNILNMGFNKGDFVKLKKEFKPGLQNVNQVNPWKHIEVSWKVKRRRNFISKSD